jgi:hypothetical protein
MAKITALAENISNASAVAQTAIDLGNKTPYLPNRKVLAKIVVSPDATAAATIKIQGSDDNSNWNDLLTATALGGKQGMVQAYRYMRANQTVAGTAGTYSAYIEAGV